MKVKVNYIVYDYRTWPKRYRMQVTYSSPQSMVENLYEIEFFILPSRIIQKLGCKRSEIANAHSVSHNGCPVLFRRSTISVGDDDDDDKK